MGMSLPGVIESAFGAEIVIDGRSYVNFAGSSYLGLAGRPEILKAGVEALRTCGSGYQLARQYGVVTRGHWDAEREAAAYFGSEAALYLAGGYSFGLVAFAAIRSRFNAIFLDERSHHCLGEGAAASGLPIHTFRHLDAEDLRGKLERTLRGGEKPLVVTDGMYSTFGELAPLDELAAVTLPFEGRLVVDESHSFGVFGNLGRGACEHFNLPAPSALVGGSTGKAFGVVGGIIPATREEVDLLRDSPASRGASHGLPAAAAMCAASLRYIRQHPELLLRLRDNTLQLKKGLRQIGLSIPDTAAPVATFVTPSDVSMQELRERLMSEGICVLHSNYIGAGDRGVIRCGIFADHTREHIDTLLDALRRLL
jgi:8-amino-7-oxononanoate synthase